MQNYIPRSLISFVVEEIRADGIVYFLLNYKGCIQHCKNQKRLYEERTDPTKVEQTKRYVDALYQAGDIK